jgi:hypothetical protein
MTTDGRLYLYEEILLLALHDDKGTVHFGASFEQAAAGAILAELLLIGRLTAEGDKAKARISVADPTPTGDALLDECLDRVTTDPKHRKALHWITRFAAIKRLKHRTAERLVDRHVLRSEQDKVLFVFGRTRYPEADSRPERELTHRIKTVVLGSSATVEPRTVALVALAKYTGLLTRILDRRTIRENEERISALISGNIAAQSARQAIEALQAAIMVAVIVPSITATH